MPDRRVRGDGGPSEAAPAAVAVAREDDGDALAGADVDDGLEGALAVPGDEVDVAGGARVAEARAGRGVVDPYHVRRARRGDVDALLDVEVDGHAERGRRRGEDPGALRVVRVERPGLERVRRGREARRAARGVDVDEGRADAGVALAVRAEVADVADAEAVGAAGAARRAVTAARRVAVVPRGEAVAGRGAVGRGEGVRRREAERDRAAAAELRRRGRVVAREGAEVPRAAVGARLGVAALPGAEDVAAPEPEPVKGHLDQALRRRARDHEVAGRVFRVAQAVAAARAVVEGPGPLEGSDPVAGRRRLARPQVRERRPALLQQVVDGQAVPPGRVEGRRVDGGLEVVERVRVGLQEPAARRGRDDLLVRVVEVGGVRRGARGARRRARRACFFVQREELAVDLVVGAEEVKVREVGPRRGAVRHRVAGLERDVRDGREEAVGVLGPPGARAPLPPVGAGRAFLLAARGLVERGHDVRDARDDLRVGPGEGAPGRDELERRPPPGAEELRGHERLALVVEDVFHRVAVVERAVDVAVVVGLDDLLLGHVLDREGAGAADVLLEELEVVVHRRPDGRRERLPRELGRRLDGARADDEGLLVLDDVLDVEADEVRAAGGELGERRGP